MEESFAEGNEKFVKKSRPPIPDVQKVVYAPLELLVRAAKPFLTDEMRNEVVAKFGLAIRRPQASVPEINRLLDFLRTNCLSAYSTTEAYQLMGASLLKVYQSTLLIQSMAVALRLASIEWVLYSLPLHYTTAQNFGSFEMRELAPRHWRFTMTDYPIHPAATQGYLQAGARLLRNDTKYEPTVLNTHSYYFDITWERGKVTD